jgi:uncharacterized protein (TIGR02001 family)
MQRPAMRGAGVMLAAALLAGTARAGPFEDALAWGGNLSLTSNYIYRGLSESKDQAALQADVHVSSGGTFAGAWASTRSQDLIPYARYDLEIYLGQRFDFGNEWSASLSGRSHYYLEASALSEDYQQLSASLTWLDRWTLSLSAIPNAVRWYEYARIGRGAAWVAETSGQWLIARGLFVTAGLGYYYASALGAAPSAGYAYGNAGLAFEYREWRAEVGYYFAQQEAQEIFPYPPLGQQVAGTLTWRF